MNRKKYITVKINSNRVMYVVQVRNYNDSAENTLLSVFNICICVSREDAEEAIMKYSRRNDMLRYDCELPFWYKKHESGNVEKIVDFRPLHIDI